MNDDTIRLLRECNAGIKMGVSSLEDVLDKVQGQDLKTLLLQTAHAGPNATVTG